MCEVQLMSLGYLKRKRKIFVGGPKLVQSRLLLRNSARILSWGWV